MQDTLKIQITANKDSDILDFIHFLKLRRINSWVSPPIDKEPKYTKEGKAIRWIKIKALF